VDAVGRPPGPRGAAGGEQVLVYLGGDLVVDVREVVAVLAVRRREAGPRAPGRDRRQRHGRLGGPRAVVVTTRGTFLTELAPSTAARRLERGGRQ
jgi:hypothetical protein